MCEEVIRFYLRNGPDKANTIVGSFDFGQTVAKIVPVIFLRAQKCGLVLLVKLCKRTKCCFNKTQQTTGPDQLIQLQKMTSRAVCVFVM